MLKKISIIFLAVFVFAKIGFAAEKSCPATKNAKLPKIVGLNYHQARKMLLLSGWQPHPTKSSQKANEDPDISSGNGALFWKKGYVEVQACAGTGLGQCAFLFQDSYGNRLSVVTAGEEIPQQKSYAKVMSLDLQCKSLAKKGMKIDLTSPVKSLETLSNVILADDQETFKEIVAHDSTLLKWDEGLRKSSAQKWKTAILEHRVVSPVAGSGYVDLIYYNENVEINFVEKMSFQLEEGRWKFWGFRYDE